MSKFSEGLQYYLLVGGVGIVAASIAVALYLLYSALWSFTQSAIDFSILMSAEKKLVFQKTVMNKPKLIESETSLEQIAQLMMETQQDHVFVLDKEEKLIGVVSGIDVVKKIRDLLST